MEGDYVWWRWPVVAIGLFMLAQNDLAQAAAKAIPVPMTLSERQPGDPLDGFWHTRSKDGCFLTSAPLRFEEDRIAAYPTPQHRITFARNLSVGQDNGRLALTFEIVAGVADPYPIKVLFEDQGYRLLSIGAFLPDGRYVSRRSVLSFTRCDQPTLWASIRGLWEERFPYWREMDIKASAVEVDLAALNLDP